MKYSYLFLLAATALQWSCERPKKRELDITSSYTVPHDGYFSIVGKITNNSSFPVDMFTVKVDFTSDDCSYFRFKENIGVNESINFSINTFNDTAWLSSVSIAKVR
jgi:hypothetical protein